MKRIPDTDTITVTDLIRGDTNVSAQLTAHIQDELYRCPPVYFEVTRGLLWKRAPAKIGLLKQLRAKPGWLQVMEPDWDIAGELWAQSVRAGRQLSDIDPLIAAIALRCDAIIVTADADFDTLPVKRENWRN